MGLIFQIPIGVLAATRAGVATPRQLRRNRRWALVVCAVVAAFLPGDVVTMALETVPLYLLFELSVLIATLVERNELRRNRAAVASTG
jgi:sec-independent protein translocase protein TatC